MSTAVLGVLLLGFSLVFGEIFDAFDGLDFLPDGIISVASIGGFLTGFGAVGTLVMSSTELSTLLAALIGVAAGIALGALAVVATRFFKSQETDGSHLSSDNLVGVTGTILSGTKAGLIGVGRFPFSGASSDLSVRSDEDLTDGDEVIIQRVISNSTVFVNKTN